MNPQENLNKLIALAYSDGVVTDRERELIFKKGTELGFDEIEVELMLENYTSPVAVTSVPEATDDLDITNEELIKRLTRFTSRLGEYKPKIQLEPYPSKVLPDTKSNAILSQGKKGLTSMLKGDTLSKAAALAGTAAPIPGGKFIGKLAGKGVTSMLQKVAGVEERVVDHHELIEIIESYMYILELRKSTSEPLAERFVSYQQAILNAKSNPPKKKKGFFS